MTKAERLFACLAFFAGWASAVEPVDVPELMRTFDGREVRDLATWEKVRKPELRKYFVENMFGVRPPAAEKPEVSFSAIGPDKVMMGGKAVRKRIRASWTGPRGPWSFVFTAFVPTAAIVNGVGKKGEDSAAAESSGSTVNQN